MRLCSGPKAPANTPISVGYLLAERAIEDQIRKLAEFPEHHIQVTRDRAGLARTAPRSGQQARREEPAGL